MRSIRAVSLAFALGSFLFGAAPASAAESSASSAGFKGGSTRVTVGFSGKPGAFHGRRGRGRGFGVNNPVFRESDGLTATFAKRRGRDRRDFRHRRRGGRDRDNFTAFDLGWSDSYLYRYNRTARGNGFFGEGVTAGPGRYVYDRGYPYDYYYAPERDLERDMVVTESPPRPVRCRVEMGVRVCGG
jgi:hypothetical protein